MNNIKLKTGIKDRNGIEYSVGDIVLNTFFGDYWIVKMYTGSKVEEYKEECEYYLALYGDEDEHFMDLNTPTGFEIVCSRGSEDYKDYLKMFKQTMRRRKWFDFKLNLRYKIYKPISALGRFINTLLKGVYDDEMENTDKKL